jgi:hypothetical protein
MNISPLKEVLGASIVSASLLSGALAVESTPVNAPATLQIPKGTGNIVASHKGSTNKNILYILDHHAAGN